jgi:hypothetical protein
MSARNAMLAVAAGTLVGTVLTLAVGSEPGFVLGLFITIGAVVAALGIRRDAAYLLFPLPPFAFFVGAVIAGKVHDSDLGSSTAGLSAGFTQWIADIFFPMGVATVLVLLIGGTRWLLGRMLVGGLLTMSDGRPASSRDPRPRTAPGPGTGTGTDIDPWADPNARVRRQAAADAPKAANGQPAKRPGSAPRLGPDRARPAAPPSSAAPPRPARDPRGDRDSRGDRDAWGDRDPRGDRDAWGDPRPGPSADRRPATRNAPPAAVPKPTFQPRPARAAPSGDRPPRPPAPPRPVRPPSDSWDQGYESFPGG